MTEAGRGDVAAAWRHHERMTPDQPPKPPRLLLGFGVVECVMPREPR
jgi:hypothetical protein